MRLYLIGFLVLCTHCALAQRAWRPAWGASSSEIQDYLQAEPGWDKISDQQNFKLRTVVYATTDKLTQLVLQFENEKLIFIREIVRADTVQPIPSHWKPVEVGYLDEARNCWIQRRYTHGFRTDNYSRITE